MALKPSELGLLSELSVSEMEMLNELESRVDKQLKEGTYLKDKDSATTIVVKILYYRVSENVRIALARKYREAGWSEVTVRKMRMNLTP